MIELDDDGLVDLATDTALIVPGGHDRRSTTIDRPLMVEGRAPDPDAPDEIVVPEEMRGRRLPGRPGASTCASSTSPRPSSSDRACSRGRASEEQLRQFTDDVCVVSTLARRGCPRPGTRRGRAARGHRSRRRLPGGQPRLRPAAGCRRHLFSFVLVDLEDGRRPRAPTSIACSIARHPTRGVGAQARRCGSTVVDRAARTVRPCPHLLRGGRRLAGIGIAGPAVARWAGVAGQRPVDPPSARGPARTSSGWPAALRGRDARRW